MNFQAATTAIALAHMSSGAPLLWLQGLTDDTPVAVLAETGASGDDIRLHLKDQSIVEVQVKKKMGGTAALWKTLLPLAAAIARGDIGYGVLVVGPHSPAPVREQLARDIVRLGQGREDDLKAIGKTFRAKLLDRGWVVDAISARLRIVTVHALESDSASVVAARGELDRMTGAPSAAWDAVYRDAHNLIEFRGRRTAETALQMLAAAGVQLKGAALASLMAVEAIVTQRRADSASFSIPGMPFPVSVDLGWIPLKMRRIERPTPGELDLANALKHYHEGSERGEGGTDEQFDAETTGWFVHPCVMVAGPGMGKSTLLKRLVRSYASDGQIALVARLGAIARRMEGGAGFQESLLALSLDATGIKKRDLETQGLDRITFLLDGLDECGSMQDAVAQALATFTRAHPQTRIVLTTRPVGYDTVHLGNWTHYELVPLASGHAVRNIENVLSGVHFQDPAALGAALAFARREIGRGAFKVAVDTPLMVGMLGALAVRGLGLGSTRSDLYEQLLKLLQGAQDTRTDRAAPSIPILRRFIALFGWASLRHPTSTCDVLLQECAREISHELGRPPLAGQDLCETCLQWWEVVGMLERITFRGDETVTFTHKTFGEYCAALYVVGMPTQEQRVFLETSEAMPMWRETIDFACAMGLASEAVSAALHRERRGREEAEAVVRALRRTACSPSALDEELAAQLSATALKWIASASADLAAEVGQALIGAASKLTGVDRAARALQADPKTWTQVAALACVLASQPASIATTELVGIVAAREAPRGSDWDLWQKMLLLAIKELASRKLEPQVTAALEAFGQSHNVSVGTFIEISEILTEAGVKTPSSGLGMAGSEFVRDSASRSAAGGTVLLQALGHYGGSVDPGVVRTDAPPMHLSALISASGLWQQPIGEIAAWADPRWAETAAPILHAFATCVRVNPARVRAEALTRLKQSRGRLPHGSIWDGVAHVDAQLQTPVANTAIAPEVLQAGLIHRSDWIVALTVQVVVHRCDEADRRSYAAFAFARSGTALWAACEVAASLPPTEAIAQIVASIDSPVREGFQHLFDKLAALHAVHPLEVSPSVVESALLSEHAEVARAAATLLLDVFPSLPQSVVTSAAQALARWQVREGPYPSGFGWVPPSPRPELLKLLIVHGQIDSESAIRLASDLRPDVHGIAREFLLSRARTSPELVTMVIEETLCARLEPDVLRFLLERSLELNAEQLASLVEALRNASTPIRIATLPLLRGTYLSGGFGRSLAGELSADDVLEIQQAAHWRLNES